MARRSFTDSWKYEALNMGADYTPEQIEWMRACYAEQARLRKVSLTCREILALAKRMGYRKEGEQQCSSGS